MIKFFKDLFEKKSIDTGPLNNMVRSQMEILRPNLGSPYSDADSVNQYREWIYICSTHNAKSVACAKAKLYSKRKPKVSDYNETKNGLYEIISHPILELLAKPNPEDSLYSFLFKLDLFLEITGDSYIYIQKNALGVPERLDVLYSQFVNIQTDGRNKIIKYNYGASVNGEYKTSFTPEEIIHIKFFDVADILYGISPYMACARSNGLIDSSTLFEEALSRNLGVPSGVLKYNSERISEDDRTVIESKWQKKFASSGRAGKLLVTDTDTTYTPIGTSPRDMNFMEGRRWSRETIFSCYGIPQALLITEGVNRSNYTQASIEYHYNTILPRLQLISQTIGRELAKSSISKEDIIIEFEKDAPIDNELIIQKAKLLADKNAITPNELRQALGYESIEANVSPIADMLLNVTNATIPVQGAI